MRGGLASWESMAVSASMLEAVLLQVDARDGVALGCAFRAASALMHIGDSLRQHRVDEVLSRLLATMNVNQPVRPVGGLVVGPCTSVLSCCALWWCSILWRRRSG